MPAGATKLDEAGVRIAGVLRALVSCRGSLRDLIPRKRTRSRRPRYARCARSVISGLHRSRIEQSNAIHDLSYSSPFPICSVVIYRDCLAATSGREQIARE